ncbi:bifunctional U3 small nucleolar RNA-associated protein 15 [Babesia duncani]|uniref:Bifunctional U3 small nucleolar RNA-associated protein 15 n=1 Tax=Babesia duncani TaxID=323732 RepID=A0AAD9PNE5_9APIC|nr:bifunctional U3 small nucleolar RNA-associated protein 15 [Babesia duncani]
MGDYVKLSHIEGLQGSNNDLYEHDKEIRHFYKWLKIVGQGTESAPVSHVCISSSSKFCAISSGTRVKIYDYGRQGIDQTFTGAKDFIRCTRFRQDDKLAAISDDSGHIHFVALPLKSNLRRFQAHKTSIYSMDFSKDRLQLMTGSDDGTAKLWDTLTCQCVVTLSAHSDRIRTLCPLSQDSQIWVTGGYDGIANIHDIRCPESVIATIKHDSPIDSVTYNEAQGWIITAGSNFVKIWEYGSSPKLKTEMQPHASPITHAYYCNYNQCLVSSSLDCSVRFTNLDGTLRHAYKFTSPVLACDLGSSGNFNSNDSRTLAFGTTSGEWTIRHFDKVQESKVMMQSKSSTMLVHAKPPKLSLLDRLVKTFQYQAALDLALGLGPTHVYNLVEALVMRGALGTAVKDKDEHSILPLLAFIATWLNADGAQINTLLELLHATIEYNRWLEHCDNDEVLAILRKIPNRINIQLHQNAKLQVLLGTLQLVLDPLDMGS